WERVMQEALTKEQDISVTRAVNGMLSGREAQAGRKQRERDLQLVALGVLLRDVASMNPDDFTDSDIRGVVGCLKGFQEDRKRGELLSQALDWFWSRVNVKPEDDEKLHQAVLRRLRDVSTCERLVE